MTNEEKRKQITEEVERLEKELEGWKFRRDVSKLDDDDITIAFEKVVNKSTGFPDYNVTFYGKLNEEPIFTHCFVETWVQNDLYSLMVTYRFHGYTKDEQMNIKQLGKILENIEKIENFGKEFKKILGEFKMNDESIKEFKKILDNKKVIVTITSDKLKNYDPNYSKLYDDYSKISFRFDPRDECTYIFREYSDGFFIHEDTAIWYETDEKIYKIWKKMLENEEKYVIR